MKKILIISGICAALLLTVYFQFKDNTVHDDLRGILYAGSKTCAKCHAGLYDSYLHTAHYIASIPATPGTVHGSFVKGSNVFEVNAAQKMVMEKLDSGLFQTYYRNGKVKSRHRFDIVFGGVKGETYLYWNGNQLCQLPLSYFSQQHEWSTSPGYSFSFLDYPVSRSIGIRCIECHASFINYLPGEAQKLSRLEEFDKSTLVYGIDCERCHGPGARHADFQSNNPEVKTARYITSYNSLSRSQRIDICAVCHSGKPTVMLRSSFGFMPGDTFSKFKMPEVVHKVDTGPLDVHGNQVQLLQSSKCYMYSKMECATCHDTHKNTRGNDNLYAQKCLSCHNTSPNHTNCKMADKLGADILRARCISCHMPTLPTKVISVQLSDKLPPAQFLVHTHRIAIYPPEVKKILASINK